MDQNNLKILMVIPSFFPESAGGAENAVLNISKAIIAQGHQVEILTYNINQTRWRVRFAHETVEIDNIKIYRWGGINPFAFMDRTRFRNLTGILFGHQIIPRPGLNKLLNQYDIIHFNDEVNLSMPLYTWFNKTPKLLQIRTFIQKYRSFRNSPAARFILRHVTKKYIVDSYGYIDLLKTIKVDTSKIFEMRKGVNTDRFIPVDDDKDSILFVGRLDDPQKGADIMLRAIENSSYSGEVVFIGGRFEETDFVADLRAYIKTMRPEIKVTIEGFMSQDELMNWYRRAKILLHPSLLDTMPNAVLESMSSGVPCIVSKTGGLIELSERGGVLGLEPGDQQELTSAIDSLLNDETKRQDLANRGRQLVVDKYSYRSYIRDILDAYQKMLNP